jgi:hypothetical protein
MSVVSQQAVNRATRRPVGAMLILGSVLCVLPVRFLSRPRHHRRDSTQVAGIFLYGEVTM